MLKRMDRNVSQEECGVYLLLELLEFGTGLVELLLVVLGDLVLALDSSGGLLALLRNTVRRRRKRMMENGRGRGRCDMRKGRRAERGEGGRREKEEKRERGGMERWTAKRRGRGERNLLGLLKGHHEIVNVALKGAGLSLGLVQLGAEGLELGAGFSKLGFTE